VTVICFEIVERGAGADETARMPTVGSEEEDTLTEAEDVPVIETSEGRSVVAMLVPIVIVLAAGATVVLLYLMDVI
jgi:hypothetical protein